MTSILKALEIAENLDDIHADGFKLTAMGKEGGRLTHRRTGQSVIVHSFEDAVRFVQGCKFGQCVDA